MSGSLLTGVRLIVRKEQPHHGAQVRLTDADGMRLTCFATNTPHRPIAELELRYRLRARAEDRIRAARASGLRSLPLKRASQIKVWLEIVQIALGLLAWMPMLALTKETWPTRAEVRTEAFQRITYYNHRRLHSAIGYRTPHEERL